MYIVQVQLSFLNFIIQSGAWMKTVREYTHTCDGIRSDLKEQCQEIFDYIFLHESSSPGPLIIPIASFQFLLKIRWDTRNSRGAIKIHMATVSTYLHIRWISIVLKNQSIDGNCHIVYQTKYWKTFCSNIFIIYHRCHWHCSGAHWMPNILQGPGKDKKTSCQKSREIVPSKILRCYLFKIITGISQIITIIK